MTQYGAAQFPSLIASVGDLYGASSFRMCETQEYALDLDALDREELALEQMVQSLVERKAPVPIGVKFHRAPPPSAGIPHGGVSIRQGRRGMGPDGQGGDDGVDGEEEEEDEMGEEDDDDDMEEDEMDEEEDEGFPLDGHDTDDALESEDDPFAHEDDSLDDVSMDMDTEEAQRETW